MLAPPTPVQVAPPASEDLSLWEDYLDEVVGGVDAGGDHREVACGLRPGDPDYGLVTHDETYHGYDYGCENPNLRTSYALMALNNEQQRASVRRPPEYEALRNIILGYTSSVRPWAWYESGDEHDDSYNRQPKKDMKFCSECGVEKPLHYFHEDSRRVDGRRSRCQACRSAAYRRRKG